MDSNLLLCRPGFESDCAAEMDARAGAAGLAGFAKARAGDGFLIWQAPEQDAARLLTPSAVFARTAWPVRARFDELPDDRVEALLSRIHGVEPVGEVRLEHPDTNEGRSLHRFLKRFRAPLEAALRQQGLYEPGRNHDCLHLFFRDSRTGWIGRSSAGIAGPWENGIPRLKLPRSAPSRSALKLEEACQRLLSSGERDHWLRAGREAVDLGAAPGGWSWFLASRGLRVTAVDHGRLAPGLEADYPVQHLEADAFTWRPRSPVDWVVCDVVDKPARSCALIEHWIGQGRARLAIFNLKLPMKRRYAEVARLLEPLEQRLERAGVPVQTRAAHLYHDRDEVTVLIAPVRAS